MQNDETRTYKTHKKVSLIFTLMILSVPRIKLVSGHPSAFARAHSQNSAWHSIWVAWAAT